MALETGAAILPVAIDGTRHVLQAKGFVVRKHHRVVVTILPPVEPARYGVERRKAMIVDVRAAIARALGQEPRARAHAGAGADAGASAGAGAGAGPDA
jgi:1-acyl-sn-glycerol-3-phosphate acyltransferase